MKRRRFALEAAGFAVLARTAGVLPRRALLALGSALGAMAGLLDRRHTRIARDNLRLAYGDALSERRIRRITGACWRHFGRITLDALALPTLAPEDAAALVRFEGFDRLREARARGRGVLMFTAHFGHWEMMAFMHGHLGLPLTVVARPLDNPRLEAMLSALRTRSGNVIAYKRSAVREILKALGRGDLVGILIDQDARDAGVFVPFFGRPASTTPTLALLALRTGAPLLPVFSCPEPDGTWRVVYDPEVAVEATGDRDADVVRITAACTAAIERRVREHPEVWLWMHRRWKSRPPEREGPRA